MSFDVGDIVVRKSYGHDILFRIANINRVKRIAYLKGLDVRLCADAPFDDLIKLEKDEIDKIVKVAEEKYQESVRLINQERSLQKEKNSMFITGNHRTDSNVFELPGTVLHIDGDNVYLNKCMKMYKELHIPAYGVHLNEKSMPLNIARLLVEFKPNILVITGHDAVKKSKDVNNPDSYLHSKYFIQTVQEARRIEKNKDRLIIFAGACQSFFEAILESGANFASSPKRVNIQALDPVFVAEKCSYTSFRESINLLEMTKSTITGIEGIGGIETMGTLRLGLPVTDYLKDKYISL